MGRRKCAACHVPPLFTEPGWNLHTAAEIGIDDFQAEPVARTGAIAPRPEGLWTHPKGGFYHDGRFANLPATSSITTTTTSGSIFPKRENKRDLVEYLKSL